MILIDNPEFIRLLRSRLRPRVLVSRAAVVILLLGTLCGFMYWAALEARKPFKQVLDILFFVVAGLQAVLLSAFALTAGAQSVVLEREKGTYDFQRLVSMGARRLAAGKLFGAMAEGWWLVLCCVPFLCLPVVLGAMPAMALVKTLVYLAALGTLLGAIGLTASTLAEKLNQSSGLAILIGFGLVGLFFLGHQGAATGRSVWLSWTPVTFFVALSEEYSGPGAVSAFPFGSDWQIPLLAGSLLIATLFAWALWVLAARRIEDPEHSFLGAWHALLLFAILELLNLGTLWPGLGTQPRLAFCIFHAFSALLLIGVVFALMPAPESLRGRIQRGARNEHWRIFFEFHNRHQDHPPILTLLAFVAAYLCLSGIFHLFIWQHLKDSHTLGALSASRWFQGWSGPVPWDWQLGLATPLLVAGLVLTVAALTLYVQVYAAKDGLKTAAGILLIAFLVPPLAVALLFDPWHAVYVNPAVYLWRLAQLDQHWAGEEIWTLATVCLVAGFTLCLPAALRIRYLLDLAALQREKGRESKAPGPHAQPRANDGAQQALKRLRDAARISFQQQPVAEPGPLPPQPLPPAATPAQEAEPNP